MRATDAALLIVVLAIGWSFYKAHKRTDFAFNLFDLIMENGKVSKMSCVFLGSFGVSSWVVIRVALDGKMTEVLFAAYGAMWVAPIIAKLFASPAPPTTVSTSTISTTSTSTP